MRRLMIVLVAVLAAVLWSPAVAGAASGWVVQPLPAGGGLPGTMAAVTCLPAGECLAVAYFQQRLAAYRWNGSTWSSWPAAIPIPAGGRNPILTQLACLTTSSCLLTGTYTYKSYGEDAPLVERWDGRAWVIEPTPDPTPHQLEQANLSQAVCVTAANCTAVGGTFPEDPDGSIDAPLAEHWNGHSWAIETVPSPAGADYSGLGGLACISPGNCFATGNVSTVSSPEPLIEHLAGGTWTIQATPEVTGTTYLVLGSVSCPSRARCLAVGYYQQTNGSDYVPLAEIWNGHTWAQQAVPMPAGATSAFMNGLSCVSVTNCTAVGSFQDSHGPAGAFAWTWNGRTWSPQRTAAPPFYRELYSVSCTAPRTCLAVGRSFHPHAANPLLSENENG